MDTSIDAAGAELAAAPLTGAVAEAVPTLLERDFERSIDAEEAALRLSERVEDTQEAKGDGHEAPPVAGGCASDGDEAATRSPEGQSAIDGEAPPVNADGDPRLGGASSLPTVPEGAAGVPA